MLKILEDNTIICEDGSIVNSGAPKGHAIAKAIAEALPYQSRFAYERPTSGRHVGVVIVEKHRVTYSMYDVACSIGKNQIRIPTITNVEKIIVDPLSDFSQHPAKVQSVLHIVFPDALRAKMRAERDAADEIARKEAAAEIEKQKAEREESMRRAALRNALRQQEIAAQVNAEMAAAEERIAAQAEATAKAIEDIKAEILASVVVLLDERLAERVNKL